MPSLTSSYFVDVPSLDTSALGLSFYTSKFFDYQKGSTTISSARSPGLNNRIFSLIQEYGSLEQNWDEEGALPPGKSVIQQVFYLCSLMEKAGQRIFHVAPGPTGEVMVDLRNTDRKKSIELIFYLSKKPVFVTFSDMEDSTQGSFSFEILPELLEWLNNKQRK